MAIVPIDRTSLQELIRPVIRADRTLCVLHECLFNLIDAADDLEGPGALQALNASVQHLQRAIQLAKINRLLHLVRLQRELHLQWRHHHMVPFIDWDLDE